MKGLFILILLVVAVYGGYYYYNHNKVAVDSAIVDAEETKNKIVETSLATADNTVKSAVGSVSTLSLAYYATDRNYGASAQKNICNDTTSKGSIGGVISGIQILTKSISCVVDTNFPAKSFTLTASSPANKGQYYCTDQNGGVNLIPSVAPSSTFKVGLSCK